MRLPGGRMGVNHELIWFSMGALGFAALWTRPLWESLWTYPPCGFRATTSLPCPFCGGTRSATAWVHLDFLHSIAMNPLAAGLALIFSVYWLYAAWALATRQPLRLRWTGFPAGRAGRLLRWSVWIVLAANWVYLVAVGR